MHEKYIKRCIALATFAEGKTLSNPLVGAVIVYNHKIVAEGYHKFFGGLHAEVNAINSIGDESLLPKSTLYVNLEPCFHHGKTPPCVDLIIESGIPKVVLGTKDPNPKVNGRGIDKLRSNGVEVVVGVLENECKYINRRFFTNITKQRPYITLKWAQTKDKFIDYIRQSVDVEPLKISNSITKTLNHQARTHESAIMVGTRTALLDNPKLVASKWSGNQPTRVIIDRNLIIPKNYNIFDNLSKTVVFNNLKQETKENIVFQKIDFSTDIIPQIINFLYSNNLASLIVEGGRETLQGFIDKKLYDEIHIETSNILITNGVAAPNVGKFRS